MKIRWDKKPETIEQKVLADYLANHQAIIDDMVSMGSKNDLLTASFTPKYFEQGFFTYEIKKSTFSNTYSVIVWRGIRTGDAVPVLYGRLEVIS